MTAYERWDIILVPFPFTDLQSIKKRPSLIVSPDEYNRGSDVMIAFITSNLNLRYNHGDYKILYFSSFPRFAWERSRDALRPVKSDRTRSV